MSRSHSGKKLPGITQADLVDAGRKQTVFLKEVSHDHAFRHLSSNYSSRQHDTWQVEIPDLPGCLSCGGSVEECEAMIAEVMEVWLVG